MSSFTPDESPSDLWFERSTFVGTILGGVAYGIHICVFASTLYFMSSGAPSKKFSKWLHLHLWASFSLGTCWVGGNSKFYEKMFIDGRKTPGGPLAFVHGHYNDPVNTFHGVAYIVAVFLQDIVLMYRLLVIWNYKYIVAVLPFLALIGATILSVLSIIQTAQLNNDLWSDSTVRFVVPYISLSIALNMYMTAAIVGRIMFLRKNVMNTIGRDHATTYTNIAAIFVESGALYSGFSALFFFLYITKCTAQNLLLQPLMQAVCISQELILLRIALGRAWSRKTTLQVSEVVFRNSALRSTATHNMGRTRGSQQLNTVMPSGDDVVSGTMQERSQDTTQTPVR